MHRQLTHMQRFARIRRASLLLAALFMALTVLGGCRYSDVLTEFIEDPVLGALDEMREPIYRYAPDSPEDTMISMQRSTTDNLADQQNTLPDFDNDAMGQDSAKQREQDDESTNDQDASEGGDAEEEESEGERGAGQGEGEGVDEADQGAAGTADGQGDAGEGEGESEQGGMGLGGTGQVYDDGTYEDLPEDVRGIAATGQYALITQMIAGRGGLCAADQDWLDTMRAKGAFPDEELDGLGSVQVAWAGDGSAAGSLNTQAVIDSGANVVLYDGTNASIGDAEREALLAGGVNVVTMPRLGAVDTADADIVTAVNVVGELLKRTPTVYDASAMAESYSRYRREVMDACLNANGGYSYKMIGGSTYDFLYQGADLSGEYADRLSDTRYTTAFIDSWAPAAAASAITDRSYGFTSIYLDKESADTSDGVGLSAVAGNGQFALLDYYLQMAGVVNNAYQAAKPDTVNPHLVIAGSAGGIVAREVALRMNPSALWYSMGPYTQGTIWTTVGDAAFPAIVTRDSSIAASVVASAAKENGLYNLAQPYSVYVMPAGLAGNWADGTVESFLAVPWAYCMFQRGCDLSASTEHAAAFYGTFYRMADPVASGQLVGYGKVQTATCPH